MNEKNRFTKTQLILYPFNSLLFPLVVYLLRALDSRMLSPSLAIGFMSGLVMILLVAYIFIGIFWLKDVYVWYQNEVK